MILASLVSARALRPSIVLAQKLRGIDTAWNIRKKHIEKEPTAQITAADQNKTTGILKGVLPTDLIPSLNSHKCNVCGRIYKNRKFLNSHFKKSSNCAAHTSKMPGYLPPEPEPFRSEFAKTLEKEIKSKESKVDPKLQAAKKQIEFLRKALEAKDKELVEHKKVVAKQKRLLIIVDAKLKEIEDTVKVLKTVVKKRVHPRSSKL